MKRGFTLAEALITLAVIGVVAAFTLPTINNNIWRTQQTAAVKKMTAKIQNSLDLSISELGYVPHCGYWGSYNTNKILGYTTKAVEWNDDGTVKKYETFDKDGNTVEALGGTNGLITSTGCTALGKAMEKHLGVVKKCQGIEGCKASYKGQNTLKFEEYEEENSIPEDEYGQIKNITGSDDYETNLKYYANMKTAGSGWSQKAIDEGYVFYLPDNSYLINLWNSSSPVFQPIYYAIDINGLKGPNKWGHDIFYASTDYEVDGKSLMMWTTSQPSECYGGYKGQSIDQIIKNVPPTKCSK